MHLIIDGYNLLHIGRPSTSTNPEELQRRRDQLLDQLALYRQARPCDITVVFDGWQGGWTTEKRERRRGVELIFSRLGEKADEVIKRLVKERGSGAVVITSDREVARYAERMASAVIPSDQFKDRMVQPRAGGQKSVTPDEGEGGGLKKKGPSRRLSKKEKRRLGALRKL